jgi:hypothetical protein
VLSPIGWIELLASSPGEIPLHRASLPPCPVSLWRPDESARHDPSSPSASCSASTSPCSPGPSTRACVDFSDPVRSPAEKDIKPLEQHTTPRRRSPRHFLASQVPSTATPGTCSRQLISHCSAEGIAPPSADPGIVTQPPQCGGPSEIFRFPRHRNCRVLGCLDRICMCTGAGQDLD